MKPGGTDAESSANGLLMAMAEVLVSCLEGMQPEHPIGSTVHTSRASGRIEMQ
jgi:hypothetical protein